MAPGAPLVSVIVPAYNAGRFIDETIASALAQTYQRREIIVVDDGSTDDTADRVRRYPSIAYLRQANAGVAAARNAGILASRGDYIALLDHDDVWLPEKLEVQVSIAARHPASGLVVCDGVHVDGDRIVGDRILHGPTAERLTAPDGVITVDRFYREILEASGCVSTPSQTLIPRWAIDRVGLQAVGHCLPDHDHQVRIARELPVTLHRHSLVRWRYLDTSMSGPAAQRRFVWALGAIAVLEDETARCAPEDRAFVEALLHDTLCGAAEDAYAFGRRHDLAYARRYLRQLAALAPRRSRARPLAMLAASYLPARAVDAALGTARAIRHGSGAKASAER
jgi:glycosyltransferase involved in cell wall biosynthesis